MTEGHPVVWADVAIGNGDDPGRGLYLVIPAGTIVREEGRPGSVARSILL
jgi:hypothetical protein